MVTMNGNGTTTLLSNGNYFQNGVSSNPNGGAGHGPGSYATLPHSHHHLQVSGNVDVDQITQHWSRDNLLASAYDVNVLTSFTGGAQTPANHPTRGIGIHSRENTLSRDMHHITVLYECDWDLFIASLR